MKVKGMCKVRESALLAPDVYSLWLEAPQIAADAKPGQFVSLYCREKDRLLPRPISICEINTEEGLLRLVYRIVGEGTKEFSGLSAGDFIEVLGPLGNGYDIEKFVTDGQKRFLLVGGGIGVPPMLELARQLSGDVTVVLGYRDADLFLKEEFEKYGRVIVATDDGSVGTKGTVIDAIREHGIGGRGKAEIPVDVICSCGPTPMLRGVKMFGLEQEITTYLSLEERMACGIGACLGCVCESSDVDSHSNVKNKRVCKDGPVFLSTEVEL